MCTCVHMYVHAHYVAHRVGRCVRCVVCASSSEAQGTHWCVYMVCVCEGGKMYVVVCH